MPTLTTATELRSHYEAYLSQVNRVPTPELEQYLTSPTIHNNRSLSPAEYQQLIHPGSVFTLEDLTVEVERCQVGARLSITLVDGTRLSEFVFYRFGQTGRIEQVWSMVKEESEQ